MGVFNAMIPIAQGKAAEAREFARATQNERAAAFAAFVSGANISRETWTMLETPMGQFMLFWFEGDLEQAFVDLATDTSEFAEWFRAQIKDIAGADLASLLGAVQPELILDWARS